MNKVAEYRRLLDLYHATIDKPGWCDKIQVIADDMANLTKKMSKKEIEAADAYQVKAYLDRINRNPSPQVQEGTQTS